MASIAMRPTRELVSPRRLDIALKYRFFRHLLHGGDPDAEGLFRWHIERRSGHRMTQGLATDCWKRSTGDYVHAALDLLDSMDRNGFDPKHAVPIDPDGELLNGSHRVACALALEIEEIRVAHMPQRVWAPAWGEAWFIYNGMESADLGRLRDDWNALLNVGADVVIPLE